MIIFLFLFIIYNSPGGYTFTLQSGKYIVKCYGAQGGYSFKDSEIHSQGGKGAFVSGTMIINGTGTKFYGYVGEKGSSSPQGPNKGGFNGGGNSGKDKGFSSDDGSGGGGGATDLRIYNDSIESRIIVAAGGSGAAYNCQGSPGGDLTGYYPIANNVFTKSTKVTQYSGSIDGIGGNGVNAEYVPGSGGGGGWRGGVSSNDWSFKVEHSYYSAAHSGSSYSSSSNDYSSNADSSLSRSISFDGQSDLTIPVSFTELSISYSASFLSDNTKQSESSIFYESFLSSNAPDIEITTSNSIETSSNHKHYSDFYFSINTAVLSETEKMMNNPRVERKTNNRNIFVIIGIIIGVLVLTASIIFIVIILKRKNKQQSDHNIEVAESNEDNSSNQTDNQIENNSTNYNNINDSDLDLKFWL